MVFEKNINRVRWGCRRGMLELDLFLLPYFDAHYMTLDKDEQMTFQKLLTAEDPQLQLWFMQQAVHEDNNAREMIEKICCYAKA